MTPSAAALWIAIACSTKTCSHAQKIRFTNLTEAQCRALIVELPPAGSLGSVYVRCVSPHGSVLRNWQL